MKYLWCALKIQMYFAFDVRSPGDVIAAIGLEAFKHVLREAGWNRVRVSVWVDKAVRVLSEDYRVPSMMFLELSPRKMLLLFLYFFLRREEPLVEDSSTRLSR